MALLFVCYAKSFSITISHLFSGSYDPGFRWDSLPSGIDLWEEEVTKEIEDKVDSW